MVRMVDGERCPERQWYSFRSISKLEILVVVDESGDGAPHADRAVFIVGVFKAFAI